MLEIDNNIRERTILVGVGSRYAPRDDSGEYGHLDEIALLADTAGADVVGVLVQPRSKIVPAYYIGKGKAEELKEEVELAEANMVIFDNDLTPAQLSNLEKLLEIKVVDRSGLILDIFALRARTRQAKAQVELAQLQYLLPRLTRQWTHLSRQQGGIGTRGPGETQLEVDRRRIRQRIAHLKDLLKKIDRHRETGRKRRGESFKAALVGYTNAGKSTLLNALSGAGVPVEDKLFKTLDSVTRLVRFGAAPEMLISDTVGFIRDLPHDLIASFKSTLDEVREADALLHVIDITNPEWEEQIEVVAGVLSELGVSETMTVMVFNKIDCLTEPSEVKGLQARFPMSVFVSGERGDGIEELKTELVSISMKDKVRLTRRFAPDEGPLLSEVCRRGTVIETHGDDSTVEMTFTLPRIDAERLRLIKQPER